MHFLAGTWRTTAGELVTGQPEHMEPHTPIDHGNHDSHELSPSNTVRGNKNVTQKSLKINI